MSYNTVSIPTPKKKKKKTPSCKTYLCCIYRYGQNLDIVP